MNVALTNGILNNIHTNNISLSNGNVFYWRSCEFDNLNKRAAKGSDGVFTQFIKEAWEIDDRGKKMVISLNLI